MATYKNENQHVTITDSDGDSVRFYKSEREGHVYVKVWGSRENPLDASVVEVRADWLTKAVLETVQKSP